DTSTSSFTLGYTYDSADQLTAATVTSGSGGPSTFNATYDGAGNRTSFLGSVNNLNQYANLTYDAPGNMTADGTRKYAYDTLDRLISVTPNSPVAGSLKGEYDYDAQGRRTVKRTYTWDVPASGWALIDTTRFVYDGMNLLAEFQVQLDGSDELIR